MTKDIRPTLSIMVTGSDEDIDVSSFQKVLEFSTRILKEIDVNISKKANGTLVWHISEISKTSPLVLKLYGQPKDQIDFSEDVIRAYVKGISVMNRSAAFPPHFTTEALDCAKKLVSLMNTAISKLSYWQNNEEPVTPTQHLAANVDEILGSKVHYEYTTVEGRIEAASIHGAPNFSVYDPLTGERIKCIYPEEKILQEVRLAKRAAHFSWPRTAQRTAEAYEQAAQAT